MSEICHIIDGHYHCFKSFFALPSMSNAEGKPTNVVFGIAKLVNSLLKEKPDYVVFTFDSPGKTFRHELFPEYKANREKAPSEFKVQIPVVFELLEAYNIPVISCNGFEADDIIATIVHRIKDMDITVYIESKDKDLYQLLDKTTSLYNISSKTAFTPEDLVEKWGISPDQVMDFLQLIGDSSDNIPGIPGIGPKTASKLLGEYGSLSNILENLNSIKGSKKKKIEDNLNNLEISAKLIPLKEDVPIDFDINKCRLQEPDDTKIYPLFTHLNFESMLPESSSLTRTLSLENVEYAFVDSSESFNTMMDDLETASLFAFDLETSGLSPFQDRILGMSFSPGQNKAYFIRFPYENTLSSIPLADDNNVSRLRKLLEDPRIKKIGQNIKYDSKFLIKNGFSVQGYVFDTMLASYLLHPERTAQHNLSRLAKRYLGYSMIELEDIAEKNDKGDLNFMGIDIGQLSDYACEDADITFQLYHILKKELNEEGLLALLETIEVPVARILALMELNGVYIEKNILEPMSGEIGKDIEKLTQDIYGLAGEEFNINSPKQLSVILFEKFKLPVRKKTKTGYSTNEKVLRSLSLLHPLPEKILEMRTLTKLKNTYIDALPKMVDRITGRVHPEFNQIVTATGRLSSSNPNLQNIPVRSERGKQIRRAFTVQHDSSILLTADYSQIELRILAHYSKDKHLVQCFKNGEDIHTITASLLNDIAPEDITEKMRTQAKAVNFGIIYGQGEYGLSQVTGMDIKTAKKFRDQYFETFPGIMKFRSDTIEKAKKEGEVRTILNRKREIPELKSPNRNEQKAGERIAVNTVIQGSAADLIKKAMVTIHTHLAENNLEAKCILQIHDELVFELPEHNLEKVKEIVTRDMKHAMELSVPLNVNVGYGKTWMEIH